MAGAAGGAAGAAHPFRIAAGLPVPGVFPLGGMLYDEFISVK